jgi:hypothetical protein
MRMGNWLQRTGTAVTLSTVTLLLFLERIVLDFRYVSLEFEAVDAIMPFTAPYMLVALVIFGAWIWGLLAAVQGKRGALIVMLVCNPFLRCCWRPAHLSSCAPRPARPARRWQI